MIKLNYPFLAFKAILIVSSSLIALSPIFFNKAAGETETELYASMQRDSEIETTFQNGLLLIEDEYKKNTELRRT